MHSAHSNLNAWIQQLPPGQQRDYQAKETIVAPNTDDNRLFVINSGKARICLYGSAREQTLGYLQPGSVYVTHTPVWVEAVENTCITSWPIRQIKQLFAAQPELALGALQEVGKLLHGAIQLIEDLSFRSVESRLARFLVEEHQRQQGETIDLPGNTEAMASLLGTSRQTLSSLFSKLEADGLIQRPGRQQVVVTDLDKLQQLVQAVSAS